MDRQHCRAGVMSSDQFRRHIETLQQQMAALEKEQGATGWKRIVSALDGLQLIYEEMQTSLEAAEVIEEELLQQTQQLAERYHHYYDLFQSLPIGCLSIDVNGLILEANQAMAQLLNVPQRYLEGKPLAIYVAKDDRLTFRTKLNWLLQTEAIQRWRLNLCPRQRDPFEAELHVAIVRNDAGLVEALRVGVYDLSQSQPQVVQLVQQAMEEMQDATGLALPQSLDGLQVLVVDDEVDVREFIAAVLEAYGVRVTAVATAAAALESLEQFHPDVLVSDIRMPQEDGYSLIRKVRQLEAEQGWHIPMAALTAYLAEDREKALSAGFEAHLHKLAQPSELIEMVAQLAGRAPNADPDLLD